MILCANINEAVALAIRKLGRRIFAMTPIGVGSGNAYLNALAEYAKKGEIDLSVLAALTLGKPQPAGTLAPIYERIFQDYTTFHFLDECEEAAKNGTEPPRYLTYHSYYYAPGLGRKIPGIQSDYLAVNFRDTSECARKRGLNMVVMKASRKNGRYNCGTNVDLMLQAIRDVKKNNGAVMLLENDAMPYTRGNADIPDDCIDFVVKQNEPLFIMPHQALSVLEHAIGCYTAEIVPDGATLQLGIGQMADSIASWLVQKGRTDINGYSELISPAFLHLIRNGVITRRDRRGALLTGAFVVGGEDLYRYVDDNPDVWMTEVHETNNKDHIMKLPKFHGINSTLQMDLFSQASSEGFFLNDRFVQYTGMGGQFEFQESGMKSEGGKSILCLRSSFRNEAGEPLMSNIVPVLRNVVAVTRNKMDCVVTEYGWRQLRFASIEERARAMIELADSAFQEELRDAAAAMGLIRTGYAIPDEYRNNTYGALMDRFGDIARNCPYPLGLGYDPEQYAVDGDQAQYDTVGGNVTAGIN
jgi:4-hydroxybutyrate CoA-transferase